MRAIHRNMTRMLLFNCQEKRSFLGFFFFFFFFLRLSGFRGKVPRVLPTAYFFYPEAEVVREGFY